MTTFHKGYGNQMTQLTKKEAAQAVLLEDLKAEASLLGIEYSPNIKYAGLKKKIEAHALANAIENKQEVEKTENEIAEANAYEKRVAKASLALFGGATADGILSKVETKAQAISKARSKASALKRVIITCMNPNKGDYRGEVYKARNALSGSITRFISYNGEPQHVEHILVNKLKEKNFQGFVTKVDHRGNNYRQGVTRKEFTIVELPYLTKEETKELADAQAQAGSIQQN